MRPSHWFYTIPLRLRSLFRRKAVEQELDDELQYHLERHIEAQLAQGLTPEKARQAALIAIDGLAQRKEECRDMRRVNLVDNVMQDLRYAIRNLRKNPGFTILAVLIAALGIGANTAMFTVVNAVLLKPLAFHEPDRIVTLTTLWRPTGEHIPLISLPDFVDWRANSTAFSAMAYYRKSQRPVILNESAHYARIARVSPEFFGVLGIMPALGRMFSANDADGPRGIAVISHSYWIDRFGGSSEILNKTLRVDRKSLTIVGVAPPVFAFPDATEIWQLSDVTNQELSEPRSSLSYFVIARLKPDVAVQQAQAQVAAISESLERRYPGSNKGRDVTVQRLRDDLTGNVRPTLLILLGAVGLVLLIGCSNIAALLLARATARTREIAMRTALGASRARIIRQLLTESLVLALLAGAIGSAAAFAGSRALVALAPASVPRLSEVRIDAWVLAFMVLVSALASLLFGMLPAIYASRVDLNHALKQGGARGVVAAGSGRLRRLLVVGEIALSMLLLTGAGLLIRSFVALNQVQLGFRPQRVLVMETYVPASTTEAIRFFHELLEDISRTPGVLACGASMGIPGHVESLGTYWIDHMPADPTINPIAAVFSVITPGTFATLGVPIRQGRDFDDGDRAGAPMTVIINDALAQSAFHGANPLGRTIFAGFDSVRPMTVVGVVGDTRQLSVMKAPAPEMFMPYDQHTGGAGTALRVIVKSAAAPESLEELLRRKVHEHSAAVPVKFTTLEKSIYEEISTPRFRTLLIALFAAVALCLAMAGVYGVLTYNVGQRASEIGLRMALGANTRSILWMVVRQGLALVLTGIGVGVAASLATTRLLSTMLFDVKPYDAGTYAAVIVSLGIVTLAACYIPAWRATKVDPLTSLRQE